MYELSVSNLLERKANIEVAFAIDNSYSMSENTDIDTVKTKIKELATKVLKEVSNSKVSVSDNTSARVALVNSGNAAQITNAIQNTVFGKASSFETAIQNANSTFSSTANTERYVILVTDATDSVKDTIKSLVDADTKVIIISYDMTNNEIGNEENGVYGPVYMINTLDNQAIVDTISASILDLTVTNKLTNEILTYFDIVDIQVPEGTVLTKNDEGFTYKIDRITSAGTNVVKYKIKLKDDVLNEKVLIDRNIVYKNWDSSKEVKVNYKKDNLSKEVKLEQTKTPKFTICETYKMKIKAVNEKNTELAVPGIDFKVIGKDKDGNIIYNKTLTADAKGYVTVEKIKTLGEVTYSIKPIVNKVGYEDTAETTVIVDNDYLGTRLLKVQTNGLQEDVNNEKRIIEVEVPIKVQDFDLEVNLTELNNKDIKISNIEFRLIQPKLNSKYEMDALYAKTDENGQLFFHPAVMTKAGTYDYILSQMDEQSGYESMGNVTLRLTFNDKGKITNAVRKYNDNVEVTQWNQAYVQLSVGNENVLQDGFDFELNLTDDVTGQPVKGASYTVTVKTSNNSTYTYGHNITDVDGKIKLTLPGSGFLSISIVEETPAPGYAKSTIAKEFTVNRADGKITVYGTNASATNYFDIQNEPLQNDKVVVDTRTTLKSERNVIRVRAIDLDEQVTTGIQNVEFTLKNTVTGQTYGPTFTNEDGFIEFVVDDLDQKQYRHELYIGDIPYGFVAENTTYAFNVSYNENKFINDANNVDEFDVLYQLVERENEILHIADVEVGLRLDANLAYFFELELKDIDTNEVLEGATYDIEISAGQFSRKIKGRLTDTNGKISTRVAVDKQQVNEMTILLQEVKSKLGYKIDSTPQEITVIFGSNQIIHTPTEVLPGSGSDGQIRYAEIAEPNKVIFHHTNRKKDASDVLLNVNITTLDKTSEAAIGGKEISISNPSETKEENEQKAILDADGNALNLSGMTSTDVLTTGYITFEDLKVVGIPIPGEEAYELNIVVDGNLIRCKLTYSYNENTELVELTNIETIWGNRLVRSKNFSSHETQDGYESDINLEIYTNYDATGNLSLDLTKSDIETKDKLYGAKYDIIIERPDGTKVVKSNVEITDEIELDGIYVPINSSIYITETEAPIGYEKNQTVTLKVTGIDEMTNEVTLTKEADSYSIPRAILRDPETPISLGDGLLQSQYTLDMYDVQLNKLPFKIKTKDNVTNQGVGGFKFALENDTGAQNISKATDKNGEVITPIGGYYKNATREYTITSVNAGTYYKKLNDPIKVKVQFREDGTVDTEATYKIQDDPRYVPGSTTLGNWYFEGMNVTDSEGNMQYYIGIVINVEALDPLKVEIETVNKFTNAPAEYINYTITPSVTPAKGTTNTQGIANIDVKYVESNTVRTYEITQEDTNNYVVLTGLNFTVKYNTEGIIYEMPTTTSDNMSVVSYGDRTVKLRLETEPQVALTVDNRFYFDENVPIQGSQFKIEKGEYNKTLTTDLEGHGKIGVGAYGNAQEDVIYKVTQVKSQAGYVAVDPFDIRVHYGSNREITNVELVNPDNRLVTVGYITPSTESDYGYNGTDKGIITIKVLNYPTIKFNITKVNKDNEETVIRDVTFEVSGVFNGNQTVKDKVTTDYQGKATANIYKVANNETVEYTIKETKKSPFYEWLPEDIKLQVTYDLQGKIVAGSDGFRVIQGNEYVDVTNVDIDNFTMDLRIKNQEIKTFGVHLYTDDVYDSAKKVGQATWDVYLTDPQRTGRYPDPNYSTTLISGRDEDNDGSPDLAYGEDYKAMGEYTAGAGKRILRLTTDNNRLPKKFYKGGKEYDSIYNLDHNNILIEVEFDDEGKIVGQPKLLTGFDMYAGWLLDERYVEVSATTYGISVKVHYYPLLDFEIEAHDMYTDELLGAKYQLSTSSGIGDYNVVQSGYIGDSEYRGEHTTITYNTSTNGTNTISGLHRIENTDAKIKRTVTNEQGQEVEQFGRYVYLYERNEPNKNGVQYQQYRQRNTTTWDTYKIAKIMVWYDTLGDIVEAKVEEVYSTNNITDKDQIIITTTVKDNDTHNLLITVKYAPITTMEVTAEDAISGKGISGVMFYPYKMNGMQTEQPYEYNDSTSVSTKADGKISWEYWGANVAGGKTVYKIDISQIKTGYFGSDSSEGTFRTIEVEVTYDEKGMIGGATVLNNNGLGLIAAYVDPSSYGTNQLKLIYKLQRKVGLQINKVDKYDDNTKLSANFNVTNNTDTSGVNTIFTVNTASKEKQVVGRMIADKTVEYTLSEVRVPDGYLPLPQNLKLIVKYAANGTVEKAYPGDEYSKGLLTVDYICKEPREDNSLLYKDIEVTITNEPKFGLDIELTDKFYENIKLSDITLSISNNKGDKAVGNLTTNAYGKVYTYVGPVYPNETVEYTIVQENKKSGYYTLTGPIKFKVEYDESGKPKDIVTLTDVYSQENSAVLSTNVSQFRRDYTAKLRIYNMPEKVYLGINKYDVVTKEKLENVQFKVTAEEGGTSYDINNIVTDHNGNAIVELDTFRKVENGRVVTYTVHEIQALDSYRKIQDYKVQVFYDANGGISSWIDLSNESRINRTIYKAHNTNISKMENTDTYVHLYLPTPNDNAFDLIVKNEDINYSGLGIKGTKYDISIDGVIQEVEETSEEGKISINNITNTGNVQIGIGEHLVGEGYRGNINNNIDLRIVRPSQGVYKLYLDGPNMSGYTITELSSDNPSEVKYRVDLTGGAYATVVINEEYGQVKVTLYNETKLELTMVKRDIETFKTLEGIEFKITRTNVNTGEEDTLTESTLTDRNGRIYFDLGVAPQNAQYKYTFTELSVPDGYGTLIAPQTLTVTFDMYGRIVSMEGKSALRTVGILEHNDDNCRSIFALVANGNEKKYKVKVASEDVDTGRRINGSTFDVKVMNANNNNILASLPRKEEDKKGDSDVPDNETANLCIDGKFRTEADTLEGGHTIQEKGIIITDGMNYADKIHIALTQTGYAHGYVPGDQKIKGDIYLTTAFVDDPNGGAEQILEVNVENNDGLEVRVDKYAREIIITVKNESNIVMNIKKLTTLQNEDGSRNPIKGATFNITSEILTSTNAASTDLNVNTRETGVDGITSESIGKAQAGKTVVYTIHENPIEGYKPIEDIEIAVVYDLKGLISYVELLSAYTDVLNWTEIAPTLIGKRQIDLTVLNEPIVNEYQVILEKHGIDDGLYPDLIPGAEYEITVQEEYGETRTWTGVTNSEGKILSSLFNGYGNINISVKETSAPLGYKIDPITYNMILIRDKNTGNIESHSSDLNIEVRNNNIIIKPVDDFKDNSYSLILDKTDIDTGLKIKENPAQFEVTITKSEEVTQKETTEDTQVNEELTEGTEELGEDIQEEQPKTESIITFRDTLEIMETNSEGRSTLKSLDIPGEGKYLYTIKELKTPTGYGKDPQEIVFEVTFGTNEDGILVIKDVQKISGEYASILVVKDKTIAFNIGNKNTSLIPSENEYVLNIHKVDEEGNSITDTAIFKLTTPDGKVKYVETDEFGRLNISKFSFPSEPKTEKITIQEAMAPDGYIINREPIDITIEFVEDENGKVVLKSSNIVINAAGKNVSNASLEDNTIKFDITNKEGTLITDVDRGTYNIILTKVDADTKEIIPKEAEITVALENGQRILSRTKEDAKITILDIKAPATAGDYEYVINETKAPEGYTINEDPQIFKITFEDDPEDPTKLKITNVVEVADETTNLMIDILNFENNTVQINVENKKNEEDKLYLKSKVDDTNETIYNVYQAEDLPVNLKDSRFAGRRGIPAYVVNEAIIDTKTILEKPTREHRGITVAEFIENLDTNAEKVTIYDYKGNEIAETKLIMTGYKLKATKGNEELNYTISVKGDCADSGSMVASGNGMLTNMDQEITEEILGNRTEQNNDIAKFSELTLAQKMAMDIDSSGMITNDDLEKIEQKLGNF